MQRIETYRNELDLYSLKEMEKEYSEMHKQEKALLLDRANSSMFIYHYDKLEEIGEFQKVIDETIDYVNNLVLK